MTITGMESFSVICKLCCLKYINTKRLSDEMSSRHQTKSNACREINLPKTGVKPHKRIIKCNQRYLCFSNFAYLLRCISCQYQRYNQKDRWWNPNSKSWVYNTCIPGSIKNLNKQQIHEHKKNTNTKMKSSTTPAFAA